ncbi:hypothetical protein SAMN05660206_103100 [Sphingobacterium wenxiniae]|uniref:IPExxxVDY family protein n=1 Tax=Sphingobacterium wenxiniae TaxID=683125 RepID=A0A1I6R501_9SPHI|nr:hypothetical protein SAMN05660206_103100 [Sphingobacterium wenxiniae]
MYLRTVFKLSRKLSTVKKHLTIDFDFDSELDFILIGISCPLRDYRLCHFISKYSSIEFVRGKEDYIDHKGYAKEKDKDEMDFHIVYEKTKLKKVSKSHFSMYRYCDENFEFEYYLLNNRSIEGTLLISELPNFDYFLLIKHYIDDEDLRGLIEEIKNIPEVLLAKELDPSSLKSKENLIF